MTIQTDVVRLNLIMTRQKSYQIEEQQIKQKYRDRANGKSKIYRANGKSKTFGSRWTINIKASKKAVPLLKQPETKSTLANALKQGLITQYIYDYCFKDGKVKAQEVTISK